MSVTECMTSVSPSPMKGPNGRRPRRSVRRSASAPRPAGPAMAAAPRRAPSAPPRHSTPSIAPLAPTAGRRPPALLAHQLHRRAARARRAHLLQVVPRRLGDLGAREVRHGSPARPGSPSRSRPARRPAHAMRSRTYAISSPFVSRVASSAIRGVSLKRGLAHRLGGLLQSRSIESWTYGRRGPPAPCRCRGRAGTAPSPAASLSDASVISVRSEMRLRVDGRHELDRHASVVADLVQGLHELLPVERALAARHAVVVGHVEVDQLVARARIACAQSASSMFMWKMSRQTPQLPPTSSASARAPGRRG